MSLSKYLEDLQEKLKASDSMSDWISDFQKSDAPQFAGKSKEKRRQMAIAAKLGAERGSQNEEKYSDTGWKKPQTAAKTKNVSGNLARKAMKQADKEAKKEKGFGPSPADKLSIRKEEVELEEGKYGAFRLGPGVGRFSSRGRAQHQGLEDPRTGLPLGFSNLPKKDEPKKDEPKKVKEEVVLEMDKSQPASSRGAEGLPLGKKAEPAKTDKVKSDALKALQKQYKKVKEEVELDELDQKTLSSYATRTKFSSDPKRREGAAKAQEKLIKKSKDMQKEEAEQVDEVLDSAGKFMSYTTKAAVSGLKSAVTGTGKFRKRQAGIQTAVRKTKEKITNEEVDESIGSTVGAAIGQYAGSKLGMDEPGRVLGGTAGRAIEYHVRKFANRLKKKITGKNESVEVEEENKAYRAQDKASRETTGMSLPQRSKMYGDIQKKLKDQEEEYIKQGILPPKNEEVELDEDGKLKGGAKDPCWKGYQMVGTKKKGGREVPNCVPREETELKSFKALREELNGNR